MVLMMVVVFSASCTSVRKLVDEGRYDEAIVYSIKKLKGKKKSKRKNKYVYAIEKAFEKVTKEEMNRIEYLKIRKKGNYWVEINSIAHKIDNRQNKIDPLLPLVSKDDYKAKFKFVRIEPIIIESENGAAEYYYSRSMNLLDKANNGDKYAARKAYDLLRKIKKYKSNYKNTNDLISRSYSLGQKRVLIDVVNRSGVILPKRFYYEMKSLNVRDLDSKWIKFFTSQDKVDMDYDYNIKMEIREIDITPERETIREYEETKEVKDGFDYVLDSKGNVLKDSLGNDIKEDRYKVLRATVIELYRNKSAMVRGSIKIKDIKKNRIYKSVPINVEAVFDSYASRYEGSRKALSKETRRKLKRHPEDFPSDPDLLMLAVDDLKELLTRELKNNIE